MEAPAPQPSRWAASATTATRQGNWALAGVLALIGSVLGAIGEFLPVVATSGPWLLFGSGKFLVDAGNGIAYLQGDVIIALVAIGLLVSPKYRLAASVLLVVLGAKYVLLGLGSYMSIKGSNLDPAAGFYLSLVCGLLVLTAGLVALQEARRDEETTSRQG